MTFKSCWKALAHGKWTANRLLSRKFLVVIGYIAGVWVAVVTIVVQYGIVSSSIIETAIQWTSGVVTGWILVQGAKDWKNGGGPKNDGGNT